MQVDAQRRNSARPSLFADTPADGAVEQRILGDGSPADFRAMQAGSQRRHMRTGIWLTGLVGVVAAGVFAVKGYGPDGDVAKLSATVAGPRSAGQAAETAVKPKEIAQSASTRGTPVMSATIVDDEQPPSQEKLTNALENGVVPSPGVLQKALETQPENDSPAPSSPVRIPAASTTGTSMPKVKKAKAVSAKKTGVARHSAARHAASHGATKAPGGDSDVNLLTALVAHAREQEARQHKSGNETGFPNSATGAAKVAGHDDNVTEH